MQTPGGAASPVFFGWWKRLDFRRHPPRAGGKSTQVVRRARDEKDLCVKTFTFIQSRETMLPQSCSSGDILPLWQRPIQSPSSGWGQPSLMPSFGSGIGAICIGKPGCVNDYAAHVRGGPMFDF